MTQINVGKRIRELRTKRSMTLTQLAEATGGDVGNISRLERGKQGYSEAHLVKIADALGVKVSDLFTNKPIESNEFLVKSTDESKDIFRVDLLDVTASAGPGANPPGIVNRINTIEYDLEYARSIFGNRQEGSIAQITIRGDSMSDTIEPGDLIFVDISTPFFDGDGIYVFCFSNEIYVKRLQKIKNELRVISDNKCYETWSINTNEIDLLKISGKVILSQSQSFRRHG